MNIRIEHDTMGPVEVPAEPGARPRGLADSDLAEDALDAAPPSGTR